MAEILDYINKRTEMEVKIIQTWEEIFIENLSFLFAALLVIILVFKLRHFIAYPYVWFGLACIVYIICCGGTVHNIIKKVHIIGHSKTNEGEKFQFFSTEVNTVIIIAKKTILDRRIYCIISQ